MVVRVPIVPDTVFNVIKDMQLIQMVFVIRLLPIVNRISLLQVFVCNVSKIIIST